MMWRTLPFLDQGGGLIWNERNRLAADKKLETDLEYICQRDYPNGEDELLSPRWLGDEVAEAFYSSVRSGKFGLLPTMTMEKLSVAQDPAFVEISVLASPGELPSHNRTVLAHSHGYVERQAVRAAEHPIHRQRPFGAAHDLAGAPRVPAGTSSSTGVTVHIPGEYVNTGEIGVQVHYPLRGQLDRHGGMSAVHAEGEAADSVRDSDTYPTGSTDSTWKDTTIYVKLAGQLWRPRKGLL